MDVLCSTCREPWDTDHLFHDSIYETVASYTEAIAWRRLPVGERLAGPYWAMLKATGYEFGITLMHVIRRPGCPKDAVPRPDLVSAKSGIEELLGDDVDAIAATFSDHGL